MPKSLLFYKNYSLGASCAGSTGAAIALAVILGAGIAVLSVLLYIQHGKFCQSIPCIHDHANLYVYMDIILIIIIGSGK